jgi:hypothetical protein
VQRHAFVRMYLLCCVLLLAVQSQLWAEDLIGNVATSDQSSRSITLVMLPVLQPDSWKANMKGWYAVPTAYSITVKPDAKIWRMSAVQTDLQQAVQHLDGNAAAVRFEDIVVGASVLVRVRRSGDKIEATMIVDQGLSYPAFDSHKHGYHGNGKFVVVGASVNYIEPGKPDHNFTLSCREFQVLRFAEPKWKYLRYGKENVDNTYRANVDDSRAQQALDAAEQAIRQPCALVLRQQDSAAAAQRAVEAAAEARKREEQTVKRAEDTRASLRRAWEAATEKEPFSSIRREFDLSSPTGVWKTSLQLPDADRCALSRTPGTANDSEVLWTFGCQFRAPGADTYEAIVGSVQAALGLGYRPDELTAKMNQVSFSDPSRPAWRLVVTHISNASMVVLRITPRELASTIPEGWLPSDTPSTAKPK